MVCPHCKKNSIPFFKVWLLGYLRTFTCPECGKKSKEKLAKIIILFLACLGFVVGSLIFKSTWGILILVLIVVLIIGTVIEYIFGKLVPVD